MSVWWHGVLVGWLAAWFLFGVFVANVGVVKHRRAAWVLLEWPAISTAIGAAAFWVVWRVSLWWVG